MFVDFKFSTIKIQVSDYLTPRENSVFLFTSVSGFLSIQTGLTKLVLLVFCPAQRILPGIGTCYQLKAKSCCICLSIVVSKCIFSFWQLRFITISRKYLLTISSGLKPFLNYGDEFLDKTFLNVTFWKYKSYCADLQLRLWISIITNYSGFMCEQQLSV